MAISQLQIAQIACEMRSMAEAESLARNAVDTFQKIKSPQGIAQAQAVLALILLEAGKPADATVAIQQAISLTQQATDRSLRLFTSIVEARAKTTSGEFSAAERSLRNALGEAHRYGYLAIEYEARLALGNLEAKSGRLAAARSSLQTLQTEAQARGYARIARRAKEAANSSAAKVSGFRNDSDPTKMGAGISAPLPSV
jgi:tetratricopeptide (TPR) repeat protein